jgi:hypothetical protein
MIILFANKKKDKIVYKCMQRTTVYEYWREFRTQRKPRFVKLQGGRRREEKLYELALVFPNNRWATATYVKDSLGRNQEAIIDNNKYRIKEIIPYWKEELVYDFQQKKRIRYHEVLEQFMPVTEIGQVFSLNKNLFLQVDDEIKMFSNKNLNDSERLFELIKEDLLAKKKTNFIFVKDVTTYQRKQLYNLLESKGINRRMLFKHYSY